MEKSSYFIENTALFGSYPSQKDVKELEENGVRYFINLTCNGEFNISHYITEYTYIRYPINDHDVPKSWGLFAKFIVKIGNIIKKLIEKNASEKVYIHCRGGHGRSGIVVASLLCYIYNLPSKEGLRLTSEYHEKRKILHDRWKKIGCPTTQYQKIFVAKFFEPMCFFRSYTKEYLSGLGMWSKNSVEIDSIKYDSSGDAIMELGENRAYEILHAKFVQNLNIRAHLMNTGLRPLIYIDEADIGWSEWNYEGENKLGKMLMKIREDFYSF